MAKSCRHRMWELGNFLGARHRTALYQQGRRGHPISLLTHDRESTSNKKMKFPSIWHALKPQHLPPADQFIIRVSIIRPHLVSIVSVIVLVLIVLPVELSFPWLHRNLFHDHAVLAVALLLLSDQALVVQQTPGRLLLPAALHSVERKGQTKRQRQDLCKLLFLLLLSRSWSNTRPTPNFTSTTSAFLFPLSFVPGLVGLLKSATPGLEQSHF